MMPRTLYVIANWDRDFENAKSRTIERTTFFCAPNHFDGKKIRQLSALENSEQLFGLFHLICAVASKCWYRGVLLDNDGPISARDLANKTGFRESAFADALPILSSPELRLLERYEILQSPDGSWVLPQSVLAWAIPRDQRRQMPHVLRSTRESARSRRVQREFARVRITEENGREQNKGKEEKRKPSALSLEGRQQSKTVITDFFEAKQLICEKILGGQDPTDRWEPEVEILLKEYCKRGLPVLMIDYIGRYRSAPKRDDVPELTARRDPITPNRLMDEWSEEFSCAEAYIVNSWYREHPEKNASRRNCADQGN